MEVDTEFVGVRNVLQICCRGTTKHITKTCAKRVCINMWFYTVQIWVGKLSCAFL